MSCFCLIVLISECQWNLWNLYKAKTIFWLIFGGTILSFLKLPIFIHPSIDYSPIAYEPSGQNLWAESSIAGLNINSFWFGSISFPFYEPFLQQPYVPERQAAAISERWLLQEYSILKEESVSKDIVHLLSVTMGCQGWLLRDTTMLPSWNSSSFTSGAEGLPFKLAAKTGKWKNWGNVTC